MKWPLRNIIPSIPSVGSVGDFAFRRSFYHHPGIDIYCDLYQQVQAIEDGVIVHVEHFTGAGANPPSPWWNDTWSVMVEGKSGVIGYCEMSPNYTLFPIDNPVGRKLVEGQPFGVIIPVLKKDKGNGITMLHLELYEAGTAEHVTWTLDTERPKQLLNPRELLEKIRDEIIHNP